MKKFVVASLALGAFAAPAFAADMPVKARPMAIPYNWTGVYVGGTIGAGWGDWSYFTAPAFNSATNRLSGAVGGPTLGFNWQTGAIVLGVEGDWSWSGVKASDTSGCAPVACINKYRSIATVRGRVGYAFDRVLVYATGGGAFTRSEDTQAGVDSGSKSFSGWTAGGGLEWAFWQNWSAKIEYLHLDFGDQNIFNPVGGGFNVVHHDNNLNLVRFGVNYKFGWL